MRASRDVAVASSVGSLERFPDGIPLVLARLVQHPPGRQDLLDRVRVPHASKAPLIEVLPGVGVRVQVQIATGFRVFVCPEFAVVVELHCMHPHERTAELQREEPVKRAPVRLVNRCDATGHDYFVVHRPSVGEHKERGHTR